jgi:hypothetical protein
MKNGGTPLISKAYIALMHRRTSHPIAEVSTPGVRTGIYYGNCVSLTLLLSSAVEGANGAYQVADDGPSFPEIAGPKSLEHGIVYPAAQIQSSGYANCPTVD